LVKLTELETGDRARTQKVLATLITGMERDLARFPSPAVGETTAPVALSTREELDEHTYFAAGCVGEYWTTMTAAHVPGLRRIERPDFVARGVHLGKALQYVNVLRDTPRDLLEGRCYLPTESLTARGLTPSDLRDAGTRHRAWPVLDELMRECLRHVDAAFPYVMAIPRTAPRLRLAALWPLWIGLATLERFRNTDDPLDPKSPVKISRRDVYTVIAESAVVVGSDRLLTAAHRRRRRAASA
jgi:farnesyl-diphosphate farnesyltransferase